MKRLFLLLPLLAAISAAPAMAASASLATQFQGTILLQVQSHGEAWYVNPKDLKRYYMKDGNVAYQMMRSFGQGISEPDFAKLSGENLTLLKRFKGSIILRVNLHGEAYYINPKDLSVTYLKDGAAAYELMRKSGLGIATNDLEKISVGVIELPPTTAASSEQPTVPSPVVTNSSPIVSAPLPTVEKSQVISGVTGLAVSALSDPQSVIIGASFLAGTAVIADPTAYQVPIKATVRIRYVGYDEQKQQTTPGAVFFEKQIADADITRYPDSHLLAFKIPLSAITGISSAAQTVMTEVTIVTPSQGSFSASSSEFLLASGSSRSNRVSLSGDTTGEGPIAIPHHFFLSNGAITISELNRGGSNIFMWLVAKDGSKNLIVNEIGPGNRQDTDQIYTPGWYYLLVQSTGIWQLDLQQSLN